MDIALLGFRAQTADLKDAETDLKALERQSDRTERSADRLSAGIKRAGVNAASYSREARVSSAHTANLTAQFNDIGVMLASGQNPLQLAMQQGTQITQVFSQMGGGARQAFSGIRAGLLSMVSPLNLATLAGIAVGAMLVQNLIPALTSASKSMDELEEDATSTTEAIKAFSEASRVSQASFSTLVSDFGSGSAVMRQALIDLASVARMDALARIRADAEALRDMFQGFQGEGTNVAQFFNDGMFRSLRLLNKDFNDFVGEFTTLQAVMEGTTNDADRLQAALDLRDLVLEQTGGIKNMNDEQRGFFRLLTLSIQNMELLGTRTKEAENNTRSLASAARTYANTRLQSASAVRDANQLLNTLREEANIRLLIKKYGEDSDAVTRARIRSERLAFEQLLASMDVSESLKNELLGAWENARGLGSVDLQSNISAAAQAALDLASNLALARSLSPEVNAGRVRQGIASGAIPPDALADVRAADPYLEFVREREATARLLARRQSSRGSRGGGGSSADSEHLARQREAEQVMRRLETATQAYNRELADLRELQEMGYLTSEQFTRAQEALAEGFANQQFADVIAGFENIADAIAGAIVNSENLGEAFKNVVRQMVAELISSNLRNLLLDTLNINATRTRGGFLGSLFAGFFDKGGHIPVGKFGVTGENGPEIIEGPAHVTSTADTARILSEKGGGVTEIIVRHEPGVVAEIARGEAKVVVDDAAPSIAKAGSSAALRHLSQTRRTTRL